MKTIFLTISVVSVVSIALLFITITVALTRQTYKGFGQWTFATIFLTLGLLLIGLRDRIPNLLSIIVGNPAILTSLVLINDGLLVFAGRAPRRALYLIPYSILVFPYLYLTYVAPVVAVRLAVSSAIFAGYSVVLLILYHRLVALEYRRNWLLPAGLTGLACLFAAQVIHALIFLGSIKDFMAAGAVQGYFIVLTFSAAIVTVVGLIILNSQRTENDLRSAIAEVKTLRGIIPICASCKRIRDDEGYWRAVESYVRDHTEAEFSHSLCPDCLKRLYPELSPRDSAK